MDGAERDADIQLVVGPLDTAHLNEIERIERASYEAPWSRSMFISELVKPSSVCFGAFAGTQLVGFLIISRYVDAWHIMNLAVDPAWRRRGVASKLLETLLVRTTGPEERGYTLEVRPSNTGAIRLYERFGFSIRGRRRGYYVDNNEDALIMWRETDGA